MNTIKTIQYVTPDLGDDINDFVESLKLLRYAESNNQFISPSEYFTAN